MGFDAPNYTQVPNALFDLLPLMGEAELKVVLHAVRQTIGYHKASDTISLTQFEQATGLSRQGAANGVEAALARGVLAICGVGKRGVKRYRLVIDVDQSTELTSEPASPDQSTTLHSTSQRRRPTKETLQKKEEQKTESSSSSSGLVREASTDDEEDGVEIEPVVDLPDQTTGDHSAPIPPPSAAPPPSDPVPEADSDAFNIFRLYEQTFGQLVSNTILADDLKDVAATYNPDDIREAFRLAALANAKSHRYAVTCLERWHTEGRPAKGAPAASPKPTPPPNPDRPTVPRPAGVPDVMQEIAAGRIPAPDTPRLRPRPLAAKGKH